jgi:hypothetical protein
MMSSTSVFLRGILRLRWLAAPLAILLAATALGNEQAHPLKPPDRSTPRAALQTFLDPPCYAGPNAGTPSTEAWSDVSKEPWISSIPDMGNRYQIAPMFDGWSEVFKAT